MKHFTWLGFAGLTLLLGATLAHGQGMSPAQRQHYQLMLMHQQALEAQRRAWLYMQALEAQKRMLLHMKNVEAYQKALAQKQIMDQQHALAHKKVQDALAKAKSAHHPAKQAAPSATVVPATSSGGSGSITSTPIYSYRVFYYYW